MAAVRTMARSCGSCRKAHVRCDGQRPVCARCIRLRTNCFGYRDSWELVARGQKIVKAQRSRCPQRNFSAKPLGQISIPSTPPRLQYIALFDPQPDGSLPWLRKSSLMELQPSLGEAAIAYFFFHFTRSPSPHTVHNGYLADLPSLYAQSAPGSVLCNAVLTCSLASFAQELCSTDMAAAARQQYTHALSSLRSAIEDSTLAAENETLMAVVVLDYYWLLTENEPAAVGPHTAALEPILRLRGSKQLYSSLGWNLFCMAHRRMQFRKLMLGESSMEEETEWLRVLDPWTPICHGSLRDVRIMKACTVVKGALRLVQTQTPTEELFTGLLSSVEDLERLEDSMLHWSRSIPRLWQLKRGDATSSAAYFGSSPTFSHDIFIANYWSYQRLFHILLHETLASCWLFLSDHFNDGKRIDYIMKFSRSREAAHRAIEENIATVPFLSGQLDCDGNSIKTPHSENSRAHVNHSKGLGLWFVHVALKPITQSSIATVFHKAQAEELLKRAFLQLRGNRLC